MSAEVSGYDFRLASSRRNFDNESRTSLLLNSEDESIKGFTQFVVEPPSLVMGNEALDELEQTSTRKLTLQYLLQGQILRPILQISAPRPFREYPRTPIS